MVVKATPAASVQQSLLMKRFKSKMTTCWEMFYNYKQQHFGFLNRKKK